MTSIFADQRQGANGPEPCSVRRLPVRVSCLLAALVAALSGCDLAAVLRDELALESETLDRIAKVKDASSAKAYTRKYASSYTDRNEKIRERLAEQVKNLDKGTTKIWKAYEAVFRLLATQDERMHLKFVGEPTNLFEALFRNRLITAVEMMAKDETSATQAVKEVLRQEFKNVEAKKKKAAEEKGLEFVEALYDEKKAEAEWKKAIGGLPSDKFMNRYLREKVALHLCKYREYERMLAIADMESGNELKKIRETVEEEMLAQKRNPPASHEEVAVASAKVIEKILNANPDVKRIAEYLVPLRKKQ